MKSAAHDDQVALDRTITLSFQAASGDSKREPIGDFGGRQLVQKAA